MPWLKAELLIMGNMLHIACPRGPIVDITSITITINTLLMAILKTLGRTQNKQFKNNLWPFSWQSPLKLLLGAGFKKSLHSPIRENKKLTAIMPVDNREVMWHWKKMRHHYKWPGNKNYHQLLKWLDWKTLSPSDTWEEGLYI